MSRDSDLYRDPLDIPVQCAIIFKLFSTLRGSHVTSIQIKKKFTLLHYHLEIISHSLSIELISAASLRHKSSPSLIIFTRHHECHHLWAAKGENQSSDVPALFARVTDVTRTRLRNCLKAHVARSSNEKIPGPSRFPLNLSIPLREEGEEDEHSAALPILAPSAPYLPTRRRLPELPPFSLFAVLSFFHDETHEIASHSYAIKQ